MNVTSRCIDSCIESIFPERNLRSSQVYPSSQCLALRNENEWSTTSVHNFPKPRAKQLHRRSWRVDQRSERGETRCENIWRRHSSSISPTALRSSLRDRLSKLQGSRYSIFPVRVEATADLFAADHSRMMELRLVWALQILPSMRNTCLSWRRS
jgi:hypothetical protein